MNLLPRFLRITYKYDSFGYITVKWQWELQKTKRILSLWVYPVAELIFHRAEDNEKFWLNFHGIQHAWFEILVEASFDHRPFYRPSAKYNFFWMIWLSKGHFREYSVRIWILLWKHGLYLLMYCLWNYECHLMQSEQSYFRHLSNNDLRNNMCEGNQYNCNMSVVFLHFKFRDWGLLNGRRILLSAVQTNR